MGGSRASYLKKLKCIVLLGCRPAQEKIAWSNHFQGGRYMWREAFESRDMLWRNLWAKPAYNNGEVEKTWVRHDGPNLQLSIACHDGGDTYPADPERCRIYQQKATHSNTLAWLFVCASPCHLQGMEDLSAPAARRAIMV